MFVAVQGEQAGKRGLLRILRDRLGGARLYIEPRELLGGEYLFLRIEGVCRPSDWEDVLDICSQYGGQVIFPQGMRLPEELQPEQPTFPRFSREVMLATACEMVQRTNIPIYRRIAGLVDPAGTEISMLERLLKYYSCVRVVTGNLEDYTWEAERLMQELGAPVLVGCELEQLDDCVMVLAPEGVDNPGRVRVQAPVMTLRSHHDDYISQCITSLRIRPQREIAEQSPTGVDPGLLAAALHEFCGVALQDYLAAELLYGYRQTSFGEAVKLVENAARSHWK